MLFAILWNSFIVGATFSILFFLNPIFVLTAFLLAAFVLAVLATYEGIA